MKRDPEVPTGIAAAVCNAEENPIAVRPGLFPPALAERRKSPNADAHMCVDIETGRTGTAAGVQRGGVVGFRLAGCNRAGKPEHIRAGGHSTADALQAIAANITHKAAPQENRAMQRGQQAATAAGLGAAWAHTGTQHNTQHHDSTKRKTDPHQPIPSSFRTCQKMLIIPKRTARQDPSFPRS